MGRGGGAKPGPNCGGGGSGGSEFIAQNLITVNRTRIIIEMMLDIWVALDRLDGGWGGRVGGGGCTIISDG